MQQKSMKTEPGVSLQDTSGLPSFYSRRIQTKKHIVPVRLAEDFSQQTKFCRTGCDFMVIQNNLSDFLIPARLPGFLKIIPH